MTLRATVETVTVQGLAQHGSRRDRSLIRATQAGLPLTFRPYAEIGALVDMTEAQVIAALQSLLDRGVIRRIGAVPNHYALGYRANGMAVFDIDDGEASRLGREVGQLDFVSHCYRRPRHLPDWPYNLFAMVHGHSRDEVACCIGQIRDILGPACRQHDVLYSRRILKKTGLRLRE